MIVAANFKLNHTRKTTTQYLEALNFFLDSYEHSCDIRVYPPSSALQEIKPFTDVTIGAQNFYPSNGGAFTGEIGEAQLEEFNIKSVLIGHSERRTLLKENQDFIAKKYEYAASKDWDIIYCIGEPQEVRNLGFETILEYLLAQLDGIDLNNEKLVIAYEPIWAIGSGKSAQTKDIKQVLDALKNELRFNIPLLYGGSVNLQNVVQIASLSSCDGVLVGSASCEVSTFCDLIKKIESIIK